MILIIKSKGVEYTCQYDEDDHELISKYKWSMATGGYAKARIDGKTVIMHKLLTKSGENEIVDHIDHNKLNNKNINLRIVDASTNCQNVRKRKREDATSKYIGVSFKKGSYRVEISKQGVRYYESYIEELHAAHSYDLLAKELFGQNAKVNGVDAPSGFVRFHKSERSTGNEKFICLTTQNKWKVQIAKHTHKYCQYFSGIQEAIAARDEQLLLMDDKLRNIKLEHSKKEITRNAANLAVIMIQEMECVVSDTDFHWLSGMGSWNISTNGYSRLGANGRLMHRIIMEKELKDSHFNRPLVDHIDGNRLNNSRLNLRVVDALLNSHNVKKRKINNTSSKYVGVVWMTKAQKYAAKIVSNGVGYYCGSYLSQEVAALAVFEMSKMLYGDNARTIDESLLEVKGWIWDPEIKRMIPQTNAEI